MVSIVNLKRNLLVIIGVIAVAIIVIILINNIQKTSAPPLEQLVTRGGVTLYNDTYSSTSQFNVIDLAKEINKKIDGLSDALKDKINQELIELLLKTNLTLADIEYIKFYLNMTLNEYYTQLLQFYLSNSNLNVTNLSFVIPSNFTLPINFEELYNLTLPENFTLPPSSTLLLNFTEPYDFTLPIYFNETLLLEQINNTIITTHPVINVIDEFVNTTENITTGELMIDPTYSLTHFISTSSSAQVNNFFFNVFNTVPCNYLFSYHYYGAEALGLLNVSPLSVDYSAYARTCICDNSHNYTIVSVVYSAPQSFDLCSYAGYEFDGRNMLRRCTENNEIKGVIYNGTSAYFAKFDGFDSSYEDFMRTFLRQFIE